MEAVIATGGKQYRVAPGQVISIEKVPGEKGSAVEFRSVLLVTKDGEVIAEPVKKLLEPATAASIPGGAA